MAIAAALRRWLPRPRFSLRTLLIAMLFIGSAMMLWWKWDAWPAKELDHAERVWNAHFSPSGEWLMTCAASAYIWRPDGTYITTLGSEGFVENAVWSPDNRVICTLSNDTARIWNTRTWECVHALEEKGKGGLSFVHFSPDSTRILTTSIGDADSMHLWDLESGSCLAEFGDQHHFESFSADGRLLLINVWWPNYRGVELTEEQQQDSGFELWDAQRGQRMWRVKLRPDTSTVGYPRFSTKDARIISVEEDLIQESGQLSFWVVQYNREYDLESGRLVDEKETGRRNSFGGRSVRSYFGWKDVLSPDRSRRISQSKDRMLLIRDNSDGKTLCQLPGFRLTASTATAEFSLDGQHIVAANYSYEKRVWLFTRRRPEYWWGIAWLPEFWLTLVFACVLVWSLVRGRRESKTGNL